MKHKPKLDKKLLLAVVLAGLLSVQSVCGQQQTYESAAVGRIVGDNPDELLKQLTQDDLNLHHATYYTGETNDFELFGLMQPSRAGQIQHIIENKFIDDVDTRLGLIAWPETGSEWKKNELIVLERSDLSRDTPTFGTPTFGTIRHPLNWTGIAT